MQYRKLGKSGMDVSEIGFGAWAIGGSWGPQNEQDSVAALHKALDLGVNFIDTAAGYGDGKSERIIAEVLKTRKEKIVVATKTPPVAGHWPPSPYDDMDERYPEKASPVNALMTEREMAEFCPLDANGDNLLRTAVEELGLSARGHARIIKVARTIADLAGAESIGPEHLGEAIQYRILDRKDAY